jgi:hypothetical protein
VPGRPFIGSEGSGMAGWEGESSGRTLWRWWWPSGTITPAISASNEAGGMMRGEGKWQGRRPLRGGEGADGEAIGCGGRRRSGVGRQRRPAKGRRRGGCGGGPGRSGGQCPVGREASGWVQEKGGGLREEEGEAGRLKAKAQTQKQILFEF